MPKFRLLLVLIPLLFALGGAQAKIAKVAPPNHNDKRALVIGNDDYRDLPKLERAVNDARAVGEAMTKIGFDVTVAPNLTREGTLAALKAFADTLYAGDTAFVFFAGQAFAADGAEYLVPIDAAKPSNVDAAIGASLTVDEIIASVGQGGPARTVLVVDGCRDNPFKSSGQNRSYGLKATSTPQDAFVIFSTSIGQVAFEKLSTGDTDPNSVFTREFIKTVGKPGQNLVEFAQDLRTRVSTLATGAGYRQMPAYFDMLTDNYTLVPAK